MWDKIENIEKVIKTIRKQIDDMKEGKFAREDILISKKSIIDSIESIKENNNLISEFLLEKILIGDNRTANEILEDIGKVTREEIVEISNRFTLDTIYFLRKFRN